jgi:hypothetical protein
LDVVEVMDDGTPAEVEEVLAGATIANARALPATNMRRGMLHLDRFSEIGSPLEVSCR